jgi:hypothetical protein
MNIFSVFKISLPLRITVAKVSKPSKASSAFTVLLSEGERLGEGKVVL